MASTAINVPANPAVPAIGGDREDTRPRAPAKPVLSHGHTNPGMNRAPSPPISRPCIILRATLKAGATLSPRLRLQQSP